MKTIALLGCALGLCAGTCAILSADQSRPALAFAGISQRTTNEFAKAIFFKPAEPKTNELAFSLAPLILQEVRPGQEPSSQRDRFDALSLSNVFWQIDTVQVHGKPHIRVSYAWRCAQASLQGVRLTLNSAGHPVIWEVLADSSGARIIYVSQSVEAAAAAEFGQPLPGRRYAVERSLAAAPKVVVARVIDDGPVAMGPIVYVGADARDVTTVICRCMPAQAKKLLATTTYDLLPVQALPAGVPPAFWPPDPPTIQPSEGLLRLPSAF
jgi:hypothetical protein